MDGFCALVNWLLVQNGMTEASIYVRANLELPGYFRPTKQWDMLVVHEGHLIAALEFKSQRGPSFGNNFNNRTEEALGNAKDLWTAYREGAFGKERPRPWLGWLMLLEDSSGSRQPVGVEVLGGVRELALKPTAWGHRRSSIAACYVHLGKRSHHLVTTDYGVECDACRCGKGGRDVPPRSASRARAKRWLAAIQLVEQPAKEGFASRHRLQQIGHAIGPGPPGIDLD